MKKDNQIEGRNVTIHQINISSNNPRRLIEYRNIEFTIFESKSRKGDIRPKWKKLILFVVLISYYSSDMTSIIEAIRDLYYNTYHRLFPISIIIIACVFVTARILKLILNK